MKTLLAVLLLGAATVSPAATPAPDYASYFDKLPCVHRIGRCFDATLAGQEVVVIADKNRSDQLTKDARQKNSKVRDVYWEVPAPVDGKKVFDIVVRGNALGRKDVGDPIEDATVTIFPLQEQALSSEREIKADEHVRVNGQAVLTEQNTLTQDDLPPGEYVLSIRYRGSGNWDQKRVYVVVK